RKDPNGRNVFGGGFLGLDNIGVFDRSKDLPEGGRLEQADGTGWMAFFCASMLSIAFELASEDPVYADVASKFFEHYIAIAHAMNTAGGSGLWDEEDGFYYDRLICGDRTFTMKLRSMVGIVPLFTVDVLEDRTIDRLPNFRKRMNWFLKNRGEMLAGLAYMEQDCPEGEQGLRLLSVPTREKLERILGYVLDEKEFLSPYGVRSMSKAYDENPYVFKLDGSSHEVRYTPAESRTSMFGGNSNWRGPVWFPLNFLLIEALQRFHRYYGDDLKVECPTGSGVMMTLAEVAQELERRLISLFQTNEDGRRPCHGDERRYTDDPAWRDLVLFYEYFDGDNGRGCGASHQTGWTALAGFMLEHVGGRGATEDLGSGMEV
ncbi:MAG: glucosidase, partial [Planctomycetota bacterium]